MNKPDSAFPHHSVDAADQVYGLSKREYFAAKAMQGLLAECPEDASLDITFVGSEAVKLADALIKALEA